MRREVRYAHERLRDRVLLANLVWYTLPWYRKLARTLVGLRPESL